MSKPKELNFFIEERNWPRGLDWYRRHFDAGAKVRGEASPNYTAYPQHVGVPERMHSVVPDAKLLYMVRDPLDRIAAHWVHNYAKRREKGDLRATLMHPNTSYLARSHYYMQLQQFLRSTRASRSWSRAGGAPHRAARDPPHGSSSSSASTPTSRTPASARAPRDLAQDPGHAARRAAGAARASTRGRPASRRRLWLALDERLPLRRPIERPDVRAALARRGAARPARGRRAACAS